MDQNTQIIRGEILSIVPRQGGLVEMKFGGTLPVPKNPTIEEVADWQNKSVDTIKRWCKAKKIPHHYSRAFGYRFSWAELFEWFNRDFVPAEKKV